MTDHIFSYGMLWPQHAPPEIAATVRRLRPVDSACLRGRLYDLGGGYPGAIPSNSSRSVIRGEVFELPSDAQTLTSLDSYEGFVPSKPALSLFVRRIWPVVLDDGTRWSAGYMCTTAMSNVCYPSVGAIFRVAASIARAISANCCKLIHIFSRLKVQ